jgi:hypothetical protein
MSKEEDRLRRCITMAMGCIDPLSKNVDERLAWYRLLDALEGREARPSLTSDNQKTEV